MRSAYPKGEKINTSSRFIAKRKESLVDDNDQQFKKTSNVLLYVYHHKESNFIAFLYFYI